jgi:hypothetical protein
MPVHLVLGDQRREVCGRGCYSRAASLRCAGVGGGDQLPAERAIRSIKEIT